MSKFWTIVGMIIGGVLLALVGLLVSAWVFQIAWNAAIPAVFGLITLSYGQSFGFCLLISVISSFFRVSLSGGDSK